MNSKRAWVEKRLAVCRERYESAAYDAEAGRDLAVALVEAGKATEAERLVREILDQTPFEPMSWGILAFALRGRPEACTEREQVLRHALTLDPSFTWAARELAMQLEETDRLEEAEEVLRTALGEHPQEAETLYALGQLMRKLGRFEEEARLFKMALEARPLLSTAARALSASLSAEGKLSEAVQVMRVQLERDGLDSENALELGRLKGLAGDTEEAERLMRLAVDQDPFTPNPRCALAWFLCNNGRHEEALQLLTAAIAEEPLEPEFPSYRGRVRQEVGDLEGAADDYATALDLDPGLSWARRELWDVRIRLGQAQEVLDQARVHCCGPTAEAEDLGCMALAFLDLERQEAAEETLRQALARNPYYSWAARELARLLAERREDAEAREVLRDRIAKGRPEPMDWGLLAEFLRQDGAGMGAEKALRQVLDLDPRNGWANRELALLLGERGELGTAESLLSTRVQNPEAESFDFGVMGWIKDRQGRDEEALAWHLEALRRNPVYSFSLDRAVSLLVKLNRVAEAEGVLHRCLEVEPENAGHWVRLSEVLLIGGDQEQLERALREALQLDPTFSWGGCKLADILADRGDVDAAVATLQRILVHNGLDAFVWAHLARLQLERDPREAERSARVSLQQDGGNVEASQVLLAALTRQGRYAEAREQAGRMVDRFPESLWPGQSLFETWFRAGQYPQAEEVARGLIADFPEEALGSSLLARALLAQDKEKGALLVLQDANGAFAHRAGLHHLLGFCHLRLGNRAEAETAWRCAHRLQPEHSEVRLALATLLDEGGDESPEVMTLLEGALPNLSEDRLRCHAVGLLCRQGAVTKAEDLLRASKSPALQAWAAVLGADRGNLAEADAHLADLPGEDPDVLLARALVASRRGRRLRALRLVRRACRAGLPANRHWFGKEWLPLRLYLRCRLGRPRVTGLTIWQTPSF